MSVAAIVVLLAIAASPGQAATKFRVVRAELPERDPGEPSIRATPIGEIPTMWTVERPNPAEEDFYEPSAYGRIVENVGDVDGRGGDDLIVGTWGPASESIDVITGERETGEHGRLRSSHWKDAIASVAAVGDIDRDGAPDFAVVEHDRSYFWNHVDLHVSDGNASRVVTLPDRDVPRTGTEVAALGRPRSDRDGDRWGDLVVAHAGDTAILGHVLSSRTGIVLATLAGERPFEGGGARVAADESWIAISSPLGAEKRGSVRVWSAESLELALVIEGSKDLRFLGSAIEWVAPHWLAVSSPWAGSDRRGAVFVYDVRDGALVRAWDGERRLEGFGASLDGANDLDGDGVRDLVVGAPGTLWARDVPGAVDVLCGATGRKLLRIVGPPADGKPWTERSVECHLPGCDACAPGLSRPMSDAFGLAVATGDFDADGLADLAIGFPCRDQGKVLGRVLAISGVELRSRIETRAR